MVHHGPGLLHNAGRVQGGTPGIVVLAGVARPFVEQVPAELHRFPDGAAEEVADRPAEELALDIQRGDVKRGQHAVGCARTGDHAAHAVAALDVVLLQCLGNPAAQSVDVENIRPGHGRGRELKPGKMAGITVGFTETRYPGIRLDLHDGPQREGFVDTDRVQERRVLERHRRDGNACNPGLVDVLGGIVCLVHCAVLLGWLGVDLPAPFTDHKGSHRSKSKLICALNNSVKV